MVRVTTPIRMAGPSKAAGVKGPLIEGVHGPGRQVARLMV
jgi:L-lactate utilization protein LutC